MFRFNNLAMYSVALLTTSCANVPWSKTVSLSDTSASPPEGLVKLCIFHPSECPSQALSLHATHAPKRPATFANASTSSVRYAVTEESRALPLSMGDLATLTYSMTETSTTGSEMVIETDLSAGQTGSVMLEVDELDIQRERHSSALSKAIKVNNEINHRIIPHSDLKTYGQKEYWNLPLTFNTSALGDCEDFALEKRRALIRAGVPPEDLVFAVAYSEFTGHHAVLILLDEGEEYVLDNVDFKIKKRKHTNYKWIKRQITGTNAFDWAYYE